MATPREILDATLAKAVKLGRSPAISDKNMLGRIDYVCRCIGNRAGVRLLMSCTLAKIHRPEVDPRKPYTEIGGKDSFSGRTYDEQHLTGFISANRLPCNSTTAFLTPALRNQDAVLTTGTVLVGCVNGQPGTIPATFRNGPQQQRLIMQQLDIKLKIKPTPENFNIEVHFPFKVAAQPITLLVEYDGSKLCEYAWAGNPQISAGFLLDSDTIRQLTEGISTISDWTTQGSEGAIADKLRKLLPDFDKTPQQSEFESACIAAARTTYMTMYARARDQEEALADPNSEEPQFTERMEKEHGSIMERWPIPPTPLACILDVAALGGMAEQAWDLGNVRYPLAAIAKAVGSTVEGVLTMLCFQQVGTCETWDDIGEGELPAGLASVPVGQMPNWGTDWFGCMPDDEHPEGLKGKAAETQQGHMHPKGTSLLEQALGGAPFGMDAPATPAGRFPATVMVTGGGVQFGNTWLSFDKMTDCQWEEGPERKKFYRTDIMAKGLMDWYNDQKAKAAQRVVGDDHTPPSESGIVP